MSGRRNPVPPEINQSTCIGCGVCVENCVSMVLEMKEAKAAVTHGEWCINCGHCGALCPTSSVFHRDTAAAAHETCGPESAVSATALLQLLRERRSERVYKPIPVPRPALEQIINAGRYAPTGTNSQNVQYIVIDSKREIDQLRQKLIAFYEKLFNQVNSKVGSIIVSLVAGKKTVDQLHEYAPIVQHAKTLMEKGEDRLLYHAPVVVIVHAPSWDTCSAFNGAVALYNCSLMAHSLGIGCCFNGFLENAIKNDRALKRWLGIPKDHHCYGAMTCGYRKVAFKRLIERNKAPVQWR